MAINTTSIKNRRMPVDIRQEIFRAIDAIQYGSIEIIIHDGQITQIECREKIRIDRLGADYKGK
jgi:hypothetical protein